MSRLLRNQRGRRAPARKAAWRAAGVIGGLLVALLWAGAARAQDGPGREETEQRLKDLQEQIAQDRQRLSQTAEVEKATLETLEALDRQIALREELINTYRRRLRELSLASDSLRTSLSNLEHEVGRLKQQYRRRATHAYKYGRLHDLALILSSESINQMIIRARYLRRFGQQRQRRLGAIREMGSTLQERRATLLSTREQTQVLLSQAQAEENELTALQKDRRNVIAELRSQQASLQQALARKQNSARELENRIRALVTSETSRRRSREAANPAAKTEFVRLTGSFLQNRGQLPWPAEGVVTEPFGNRVNPVYGTTTSNPGVLIATRASAEVRAVFDGEVELIDVLPDYGTLVTLSHGEYQSVYSNFSMVYVGKGDRVRAGQILGRAGTSAEPRGDGVFFGLFKNGEPVDPLPWLRDR